MTLHLVEFRLLDHPEDLILSGDDVASIVPGTHAFIIMFQREHNR